MHTFKTILLPVDFSEHSRVAADLAGSLAANARGRLVLLHVTEINMPPLYGAWGPATNALATLPESLKQQFAQYPIRTAHDGVQVERRQEEGGAAATILRVARELQPDLIVLGSHGRSGLARLLMGSVAETVLRDALCPVLIVKSPMKETARTSEDGTSEDGTSEDGTSEEDRSQPSGDEALRHALRVPHD